MWTMDADRGHPNAPRWGASALLLATTALLACSSGEEPGALPKSGTPVRVEVTVPVTRAAVGTFPATIEATRRARIATRTSGRIDRVAVEVGDRVSAGDELVVLDDQDVRSRIEAAASQAELARKTFERVESLAADGAASSQELDEARARKESAEAGLATARSQTSYTRVVAPFGGVITERSADPGDLAAPGRSLLTLVGSGGRKLTADLPASLEGRVAVGDSARVVAPGSDVEIPVRISRVVPALSPSSRSFRVEAGLSQDAAPRPGTFVRLTLFGAGEGTRWVPGDAVVRRGQLTGVFMVEDSVVRLRWIRPGMRRPGALELLAGPVGQVVRHPDPTLMDGAPVAESRVVEWSGPGAEAGRVEPTEEGR